jgi:UDP-4-amino-4,6-dideoxy-N-acetyl-beta-L-altrosamine N-acetyltransferase
MSMFKFHPFDKKYIDIVYEWRRDRETSQYMFSDIENDYKKHVEWFNNISKNKSCKYWIIKTNEVPIGLINLASIDEKNRRLNAGYYIGEKQYRILGALPLPYVYNYVFKTMKFRKIYGEVISSNNNILKIHEMHGYDKIGVYKDHIKKDDTYHDVVIVELLSEKWLNIKKYKDYVADFPV